MPDAVLPDEVKAAAQRKGFSSEQYNNAAFGAELSSIQLSNLALEAHADVLLDTTEQLLAFDRTVLSCKYDEESNSAATIFQYSVTASVDGSIAFRCVADYAVVYQVQGDVNMEAATSFCKHVGSFAAYPYFRAIVAQMAWNSGIEIPPLPTIAAMPTMSSGAQDG